MSEDQLSRRSMLSAAAIGAAGLALGRQALGADIAIKTKSKKELPTAAPSNEPIALRWGLIGTGTRGAGTHVPVLKSAPGSELLAMCDIDEGRLSTAVEKHGKPVKSYKEWQQVLSDKDVNAVIIATPNFLHREMLQAALQAGKHVLCEKPFGVGIAEALEMKKAVEAAKTVVMFGMQYRNRPQHQKVAQLLAEGKIGKPRYMIQNVTRGDWNTNANVFTYSDPKVNGGKAGNWRFSQAATGGTLNEFSCHYFDLLHGLAGAIPERVSGDGGILVYKDGRNTWDYATSLMSYPGGLKAVHTLSLFGPGGNTLSIHGEEGSIEVDEKITVHARAMRGRGAKSTEIPVETPKRRSSDDATVTLYEDFLACIMTGKKPDASLDRALAASMTCFLTEQSAEKKAEVAWVS